MNKPRTENPTAAGLTQEQWTALVKRVGTGMATKDDADPVEQIGLLPQAIRIRSGSATHKDAVLINIQAGMKLLDAVGYDIGKSGTGKRRDAA
jgi:hypothetical protein